MPLVLLRGRFRAPRLFRAQLDGVETVLDPTLAYCINPGEEQRYDHPHADGDDCTTLALEPGVVASLCGGEAHLPATPLRISPPIDLEHRVLLAAARRGCDSHEILERATVMIAGVLEQVDSRRLDSGRPVARARLALADGVRQALAENPDRSLSELADALSVSPHHLSRVFQEQRLTPPHASPRAKRARTAGRRRARPRPPCS